MTTDFKTNPLYFQLEDKLKKLYKYNFEGMDDFFYVYHKSMTFFIECFDENPNTFTITGGLSNVETVDGPTSAYNDEFILPDFVIEKEKDVDDFIEEFNWMVKGCDADKRINKIYKAVEKLNALVEDNNFDRDFTCELLYRYFDI